MSKRELYYEVLPPDGDGESVGGCAEDKGAVVAVDAIVAERDAYEELMTAARAVSRVRYRVSKDYSSNASSLAFITSMAVLAGGILLSVSKNKTGQIVIASLLIVTIIAAIAVMIANTSKARKVWYCCFASTERGIFCTSFTGDRAVVFAYGTAYRIEGDRFYTLDESGFVDFLDGECAGLFSVLEARREDVSFREDEGCYFVRNRVGGGHSVFIEDGRITRIESEQPYYTDDVDAKTGERVVKTDMYIKVDPTDSFAWEIPPFVKDAFDGAGVRLPDMSGL